MTDLASPFAAGACTVNVLIGGVQVFTHAMTLNSSQIFTPAPEDDPWGETYTLAVDVNGEVTLAADAGSSAANDWEVDVVPLAFNGAAEVTAFSGSLNARADGVDGADLDTDPYDYSPVPTTSLGVRHVFGGA